MVRSRESQRFFELLLNKGRQLFLKLSCLTFMHTSFPVFAYFLSSSDEAAKPAADVRVRVYTDINSGGFLADVGRLRRDIFPGSQDISSPCFLATIVGCFPPENLANLQLRLCEQKPKHDIFPTTTQWFLGLNLTRA